MCHFFDDNWISVFKFKFSKNVISKWTINVKTIKSLKKIRKWFYVVRQRDTELRYCMLCMKKVKHLLYQLCVKHLNGENVVSVSVRLVSVLHCTSNNASSTARYIHTAYVILSYCALLLTNEHYMSHTLHSWIYTILHLRFSLFLYINVCTLFFPPNRYHYAHIFDWKCNFTIAE